MGNCKVLIKDRKMIFIQDKYNNTKIWVIIKIEDTYYINQKIYGKIFYKNFIELTKTYIESILEVEFVANKKRTIKKSL